MELPVMFWTKEINLLMHVNHNFSDGNDLERKLLHETLKQINYSLSRLVNDIIRLKIKFTFFET